MQQDRSIQDIMETLALSDDESQLSFSAKEMRAALNLYISYRKQAEEWKRLHHETRSDVKYPPRHTEHSLQYDTQRARVQGWNACLEMMKELNA